MADLRKDPSPNELLDRMVQLETRQARIEGRLDELASDLQRLVKAVLKSGEQEDRFRAISDQEIADLGARVKKLELTDSPPSDARC